MTITKELEATIQLAIDEARRRRHEYLTLEHVLFAMAQDPVAAKILHACGADLDKLGEELESVLEGMETLPEGVEREPEQTAAFWRVLQRAAMHVQSSGKERIDAGNLLVAFYREPHSHAVYLLEKLGVTRLDVMNYISHGIAKVEDEEEEEADATLGAAEEPGSLEDAEDGDAPTPKDPLKAYTQNLVERAAAGKIDPLVGRANELQRTIQVLCRRRKNNPVFVGEPGVGKTAIVEGLALAIHEKKVPSILADAIIYSLDMGALLAGTKFRGQFEERLKGVIKKVSGDPRAILFIDEIHTVVGAGATSGGSMDASNLLKPALANGDLRCIGSTTFPEYKSSFEKDRALARRFQKIEVLEPSVDETVLILKGLRQRYEEHHGVKYTDEALQAAAELAAKHLNDRFLPDKAIDVMDEAGSAARVGSWSREAPVEEVAPPVAPRAKGASKSGSDGGGKAKSPDAKSLDSKSLDGKSLGVKLLGVKEMEEVVARIARIPEKTVSASDEAALGDLDKRLKAVIYGQDKAVDVLASAIKLSRSGLANEGKPIGSFLFSGPTGVGKTELAKQLAAILGVEFMRFDMTEYMEKHTVSRLIGAPPGYVGFDQGGLLTDAIRRTPYAVLLLDEIEKAHPDVFNILLQVMDHATLTDNNGRKADFRHVIIILTTNAGAREMSSRAMGFSQVGASFKAQSGDRGKEAIERTFSPEFRNRLDGWIAFAPLETDVILRVVDKMVGELKKQLVAKHVELELDDDARRWLGEKGFDPQFGARPMGRLIQEELKKPLAEAILFGALKEKGGKVKVSVVETDGVRKLRLDY